MRMRTFKMSVFEEEVTTEGPLHEQLVRHVLALFRPSANIVSAGSEYCLSLSLIFLETGGAAKATDEADFVFFSGLHLDKLTI